MAPPKPPADMPAETLDRSAWPYVGMPTHHVRLLEAREKRAASGRTVQPLKRKTLRSVTTPSRSTASSLLPPDVVTFRKRSLMTAAYNTHSGRKQVRVPAWYIDVVTDKLIMCTGLAPETGGWVTRTFDRESVEPLMTVLYQPPRSR